MSERKIMQPELVEPLEILTRAWLLIQGGWCQKAEARDRWRHPVDLTSPKATKFCAAGALMRAAVDVGSLELDGETVDAQSWQPEGAVETAFAYVGKQLAHVFDVAGVKLKTFETGVSFLDKEATAGSVESEPQFSWSQLVVIGNDMRLASWELIDAVLTMAIVAICSDIKAEVRAAEKSRREAR